MMLGLRSFNLGSQYLSENVTSDSDTCPSASHALIMSTSSPKMILWNIQRSNLSILPHKTRCIVPLPSAVMWPTRLTPSDFKGPLTSDRPEVELSLLRPRQPG